MANNPNKVRFTIDNVHYAPLTETVGAGGAVTYSYGTPVHVPGTSNLDLSAEGDMTPWRADGIDYYIGQSNDGYSGDWENAIFPDSMLTDIWGMVLDNTSKTILETANAVAKDFALMFRVRGDKYKRDFVLYRCSAGRPSVGSSGSSGSAEVQPQSISITARARGDGKIKCCTTADTPAAVVAGWYTSVFEEYTPDPEPDPEG